MEYGYQKVLEVQKRCGVSFEEADKALKAEKGDVDKACVYAMRKAGKKRLFKNKDWRLSNFITYRILIEKNGASKVDVSMGVVLLITFASWLFFSFVHSRYSAAIGFIFILIFAVTVFSGYSMKFVPGEKKEVVLDTVAQKSKTEEQVYIENAENEVSEENGGYNTIEIN